MSSRSVFDAVRKATLPGVWSQGVKLSRDGSVLPEPADFAGAGEAAFRVRAPGHAVAPTVVLYLEGDEWACDCGGKVDPCAHVAAAAITVGQGDATGAAPASKGAAAAPVRARIAYRLGKQGRLLTIARVVAFSDGREERLPTPLTEKLTRLPPELIPTHDDVKIDRILGTPPRDIIPLARLADVFAALASSSDVTLGGVNVSVLPEPIPPRATVEDAAGGTFVLRIEKDARIDEIVAMGVARVGAVLRPLGATDKTGDVLEKLPIVQKVSAGGASELVTTVIPELEKLMPVVVRSKRLPISSAAARPRIHMDLSHQGHTLSVLPILVYGDPPIGRVDGDKLEIFAREVPVRRRDEEKELLRKLRAELHLVPGRRVDMDGSEAIRFSAKLRDWQKRSGDERHAKVWEKRPLLPKLSTADGAFDVVFELEADPADGELAPRRADAIAVLRAWRDGLELVPLEGGGWAPLPAEWLKEHGHRVADLLAARDTEKKLRPAALPELAALCDELGEPRPFGVDKLAPLIEGFESIPKTTLPEDLRADLRAYQKIGIDWLAFLRSADLGAVLADDMGLGKTLQTIAALRGRTLVVCPKSVVYNWKDEIARFRPGLRTTIYHGAKRELDATADVTLTTYSVLRLDVGRLADEDWDIIVLDEAQAIKNAQSQTARAAFELQGRFRVALSGTPVENRLEELWSVMNFANPGLLGALADFRERYELPIAAGNPTAASRLRTKIRPFVLRRLKRDVLPELPPRTDVLLHVELDEKERAVYDAVRVATKKDVAEKLAKPGGGGGVLAALEALLRLRQASCHPSLVPGQSAECSSKIERLMEALEEAAADGHKALVFSQWTSLLDLVEPHLAAAQIPFARLDGSTRDRGAVVAEFQNDAGPPVMLVSLKAGGTGLNLTAADHVFLLDPWWNPAVEDQAADRAHRIGQDRPVMVYRLVAKDTVEERILALKERKRAIADVALGAADHAGGLTKDELLALLD